MPDSKITALTSISTSTDPANDPLVIVDVSDTSMAATGTTKKVTLNQLLGASGTATLASATITGDLTVDTSTLKVDSTNNRVGVLTASPAQALDVASGNLQVRTGGTIYSDTFSNYGAALQINAAGSLPLRLQIGGSNAYEITSANVHTWQNVGGVAGTAMTLNSTGLGVGVAPGYKLDVRSTPATNAIEGSRISDATRTIIAGQTGATYSYLGIGANQNLIYTAGGRLDIVADSQSLFLRTGTAGYLNLDSSGNVGLGVQPSAWGSGRKAIQIGSPANIVSANLTFEVGSNWWNDGTNYKYTATNPVSLYSASNGLHAWYNAPTGTAGNNITFTQAMTLDGSGNLLVGTTTNAGVRLDVQTTTGNCIGRVKSNAAASTASFIIDYVETLGCTYIKKAGSDVWIYGVQNDTSATPTFKINTASNVGVQLVSGATAWTTLSDETVKDIIEPISNAVAKVGSIRSVIGKFKTDDSSKRRSFLIAQDVQSVLPEAVDVVGENNELGLRYTEVIPLLVAAIKELTARVQTLETR